MITILITGIKGLIGSKLGNFLANNKELNIIGIDDLSGGVDNKLNNSINFINLNLIEYNNVEEIFKNNKINYVYHFAAYAAECLSPFIRKYNYTNNLLVTTNLVNLCIKYKIKRLIFTSSIAVYGHGDKNPPFTEETPTIPIDPYGVAKLACEMDIKIAADQHGLKYCIIRPHNVYGDNQNIWDKYRNVLGIWMYQTLNNQNITIYGDGKQVRAFTYVDDILEALWNAAILEKSKNKTINLGSSKDISVLEAAKILINITKKGKIVHLEARHEVKHTYLDHKKAKELLDFDDQKNITSLEKGIEKMWEWARNQKMIDRIEWKDFEIKEKIYSYWK
jgi:UDP-glucose 4-epimerase